jgi:hypothetical protein
MRVVGRRLVMKALIGPGKTHAHAACGSSASAGTQATVSRTRADRRPSPRAPVWRPIPRFCPAHAADMMQLT